MKKHYIIPVVGKSSTSAISWNFAFRTLGYKLLGFRRFTLEEQNELFANPDVSCVQADGDEILVISTDAPANVISALWSMTGEVCNFIAIARDENFSADYLNDIVNCEMTVAR